MYRNCRILIRKDFLHKPIYQFQNQPCFHSHLLRQGLQQSGLLNQKCSILIRSISTSPALLQAAEKILEESATKATETAASASSRVTATTTVPDATVVSSASESATSAPISTVTSGGPSDALVEAITAATKEPTLAELGLGNMTPVGWVQIAMDWMHTSYNLPWWVTIVISTCIIRTLLFPLFVKSQKNTAEMTKFMPKTQKLNQELTMARQRSDHMEVARISQELHHFMKENNVNPLKALLVPMVQAPIFISFFLGLRNMANAPVPSMRDGGYLWFMDLTVPDQYYLLPLLTSATLFLTLELGADFGKVQAGMGPYMKYFFRGIPVIIFPFTLHFPAAVCVYWTTTNAFSLVQVMLFKIPGLKAKLGIPDVTKTQKALVSKKTFVEEVKTSWSNMKVVQELKERERIDQLQFNRAGRDAPVKTYKYDPTKIQVKQKT